MDATEKKTIRRGEPPGDNSGQDPKNDLLLKKPLLGIRNFWQFILKVIILIVIIIFWIVYYRTHEKVGPALWTIFVVLVVTILRLIWIQRHFPIRCILTKPTGCITGFTDIMEGKILEPVVGSAYGWGFGYYLLEVRDPDGNLLSDVVIYANGSGSPDTTLTRGNFAKVGATLGWVDVDKAAHDAGLVLLTSTTFTITLKVFGKAGVERCRCNISFALRANEVYIKQVGGATSNNYVDPSEPLRWGAGSLATVGGTVSVRGSANVYGCALEKIAEYTLWMIKDDTFAFVQPATNADIFPNPSWLQMAMIKFNGGTGFTPDQERNFNILDGDPIPNFLTNVWGTRRECHWVGWHLLCFTIPTLNPFYYNTDLLPKMAPIHEKNGTGKFTILLQVIDTSGNKFYDIQRVWIDNEPIYAAIKGIAGLSPCQDLYIRNENGVFKTVEIHGTAWDQLIDLSDSTQPTSDNFGGYTVKFKKQSAVSDYQLLISSSTPVPARPDPLGIGVLAKWDLNMLDLDTNPLHLPTDQLLRKGEGCTYNIELHVWDKTIVNESGLPHYCYLYFPLKIINAAE